MQCELAYKEKRKRKINSQLAARYQWQINTEKKNAGNKDKRNNNRRANTIETLPRAEYLNGSQKNKQKKGRTKMHSTDINNY